MRCKLYRRKISRALDSDAPLPEAVKRHLLRCAGCREFAAGMEDIGRRLDREAGALTGPADSRLAERIQASLGEQKGMDNQVPIFGRGLRLRPVLAAAAAWVVVGASVLWLVKSRPRNAPDIRPPFQIEQPGKYLVAAVETVNSPYEQEMRLWRRTLDGAARKLESAFDIGLGE